MLYHLLEKQGEYLHRQGSPNVTPETLTGDTLKYKMFTTLFDMAVDSRISDPRDKRALLIEFIYYIYYFIYIHLLEIYNLFGLHQLIESPSRETLTTTTVIDHIATTNKSNIVTYGVHKTSLSDHYLIYCVRKFWGACKKQHKHISTRQMKNFDQASFVDDLLEVDWKGFVENSDDIDVVINNWTSIFSLILEKHAPMRERRVSEKFCPCT